MHVWDNLFENLETRVSDEGLVFGLLNWVQNPYG